MAHYFIYLLKDPRPEKDCAVRYCLFTTNPAKCLKQLMHHSRKQTYWSAAWINAVKAAGWRPVLELIDEFDEQYPGEWVVIKKEYIEALRAIYPRLTNAVSLTKAVS